MQISCKVAVSSHMDDGHFIFLDKTIPRLHTITSIIRLHSPHSGLPIHLCKKDSKSHQIKKTYVKKSFFADLLICLIVLLSNCRFDSSPYAQIPKLHIHRPLFSLLTSCICSIIIFSPLLHTCSLFNSLYNRLGYFIHYFSSISFDNMQGLTPICAHS